MPEPLNEVKTRKCPICKGNGSILGRLWGEKIPAPWGVRECKFCEGEGMVTEAKYQEDKKAMEELFPGWVPSEERGEEEEGYPDEGDPDEGEEWKTQ